MAEPARRIYQPFTLGQVIQPPGRNRLVPEPGAGQLTADRPGGVGIVPEIHRGEDGAGEVVVTG